MKGKGQPMLKVGSFGGRVAHDVLKSVQRVWNPMHPQGAVKHGGHGGKIPSNT